MAETTVMMKSAKEKRKEDKLAQEEKELEELIKQANEARGTPEPEDGEDVVEPKEEPEEEPKEKEETSSDEDDNLDNEEKTWKKRYGDLRRHTDKKIKELQDQIEEIKASSTPEVKEVPQSKKELEAWRKKNPDAFRVIEELAREIASEENKELRARVESLTEKDTQSEKEKQLSLIKKAHPDFDDLQDDDAFHDWIEEQPSWIQNALYEENDAKAAIRVIDMYKIDAGISEKPQKKAAKEAAKDVKTKTKPSVDADSQKGKIKESEVAKMTAEEFEKRSEEIDEAIRSGNFIYDISGGAR